MEDNNKIFITNVPISTSNYEIIDTTTGEPIENDFSLQVSQGVVSKLSELKRVNSQKVRLSTLRDRYEKDSLLSAFTPHDKATFMPDFDNQYIDYRDINNRRSEDPKPQEVKPLETFRPRMTAEVIESDAPLERVVARAPRPENEQYIPPVRETPVETVDQDEYNDIPDDLFTVSDHSEETNSRNEDSTSGDTEDDYEVNTDLLSHRIDNSFFIPSDDYEDNNDQVININENTNPQIDSLTSDNAEADTLDSTNTSVPEGNPMDDQLKDSNSDAIEDNTSSVNLADFGLDESEITNNSQENTQSNSNIDNNQSSTQSAGSSSLNDLFAKFSQPQFKTNDSKTTSPFNPFEDSNTETNINNENNNSPLYSEADTSVFQSEPNISNASTTIDNSNQYQSSFENPFGNNAFGNSEYTNSPFANSNFSDNIFANNQTNDNQFASSQSQPFGNYGQSQNNFDYAQSDEDTPLKPVDNSVFNPNSDNNF